MGRTRCPNHTRHWFTRYGSPTFRLPTARRRCLKCLEASCEAEGHPITFKPDMAQGLQRCKCGRVRAVDITVCLECDWQSTYEGAWQGHKERTGHYRRRTSPSVRESP